MLLTNNFTGDILRSKSRNNWLKEVPEMFEYLDEDRNDEEKQCAMLSTLYWMALSNINNGFRFW